MKRWISAIATFASIIGLAFAQDVPAWIKCIIVIIGLFCLVFLSYSAFCANRINKIVCRSEKEIHDAMLRLIKTQAKISIMSRDLSWVDEEITEIIKKKKSNIQIFAQAENDITKQLENNGTKIMYYGKYGFEPKTRFTIIGYNRPSPQVAISNTLHTVRKKGKVIHTIYETSPDGAEQDQWINSLALDLMDLCMKCCEEKHNG